MNLLADSDTLIEVTRGRNEEVLHHWSELNNSSDALLCSAVSIAELWHGAKPREYDLLGHPFGALVCVPVDNGVARQAGEFLRTFHKSHNLQLGTPYCCISSFDWRAPLDEKQEALPMSGISFL